MSKLVRWLIVTTSAVTATVVTTFAFTDSRPYAWCGWYMRHIVSHDPGDSYNLARNWAHWGYGLREPRPGAIVVWSHHVGKIVKYAGNGHWFVHSGNDGHTVRTRPRTLAGAIAFRMDPAQYAQEYRTYQVASTESKPVHRTASTETNKIYKMANAELKPVAKHTARAKIHHRYHYANSKDMDYLFKDKIVLAELDTKPKISKERQWLYR